MVLYLSSGIEKKYYEQLFHSGEVGVSLQAQRFNSLVIEGLGNNIAVTAVGHPEYKRDIDRIPGKIKTQGNVTYYILGNNSGRFRKVSNFWKLYKNCVEIIRNNKIEAIVCDAISPLYSLTARIISRKYSVPSVAIVTDIPIIMDAGNISFITKLSQRLIEHHDGYVLLTKAMNPLVNSRNKPFIIMEGLCDSVGEKKIYNNTQNGKTIILYTGSLSLQTGVENLIEAFKFLKNENLELWIYGGGKGENYVKEQAALNKNIKYGGLVSNEEAAKLQRQADILVNPRPTNLGYAEFSFPSKIMEYMASGTPVLTTRLPGIPDEYYDYLYSINDDSVEGIIQSLNTVLSLNPTLRKEKGLKAKNFVTKEKNNTKQGERILSLINDIKYTK